LTLQVGFSRSAAMCGEGTIGGLAGFSLAPGSGLCTARIIARPDILQSLHCSSLSCEACGEKNYSGALACTYHTPPYRTNAN
jgi:hypothetical protein